MSTPVLEPFAAGGGASGGRELSEFTGTVSRHPFWRRFLGRPVGVLAGAWLGLVVVAAIFAPELSPYSPQAQNLSSSLSGPSAHHLLGTDQLGRDVLSQLIYGGRPALLGMLCALAAWLVVGVTLGVIAGYAGGTADTLVSRIADLLLSLPAVVILLVVFSVFPNSLTTPMAILGIIFAGGLIRVVRSVTLTVRGELYIRVAQVTGVSHPKIVVRHVLPRIIAPTIVQAALFAGLALVIESGLAFLGFGVVAPKPSWGGLIYEASQTLNQSSWLLVPGGACLGLTVVALVLFGNAIRDVSTERWSGSRLQSGAARGVVKWRPGSDADAESVFPGALLAVEHLTIAFTGPAGPIPVVTDLSFSISPGETVALLGESGCGKTITALAVMNMLPGNGRQLGGRCFLDGRDMNSLSSRELAAVRGKRIGYVSQDPMLSLDPTFTIGAQITEAVRRNQQIRGAEAKRRAVQLLEEVSLPEPAEVAKRYPHQLSGGMLQRCVIALALSGNPDLLIADEPTTALDVTTQGDILALLRAESERRGMAILLVTHDWGVVRTLADRAVVMYAGELAEATGVTSLLTRPAHPYTRALLASSPSLDAPRRRLPAIPGAVPTPGAWPVGCRFADRCPEAEEKCRQGAVPVVAAADAHAIRCRHVGAASSARSTS